MIHSFYLRMAVRKLSSQIRPQETLACCWDVKQPTNNSEIDLLTVSHAANQLAILFSHNIQVPGQLGPVILAVCSGSHLKLNF